MPTRFSSWGPPDHGGIKPDLVANGASLFSPTVERRCDCTIDPRAYTWLSGTSMATLAASGIGTLLQGLASSQLGRPLFADEMKAILIQTAMSPHAGGVDDPTPMLLRDLDLVVKNPTGQ